MTVMDETEPETPRDAPPPAGHADFDLHGIVGIRLVGASPGDERAVADQLGPIRTPGLDREPDIVIRFVNLTALAKGALPLHAAAFTYRGTGVVVTGWAKGGKTETLLGFMAAGAEYVGDEWVYLDANGRHVHGIP